MGFSITATKVRSFTLFSPCLAKIRQGNSDECIMLVRSLFEPCMNLTLLFLHVSGDTSQDTQCIAWLRVCSVNKVCVGEI